jgi:tetratricopeptide (TPR) repeat protein
MIPIDQRPASEALSPPQVEPEHARQHGTLPPPEWGTQPEGKSRPGLGPLFSRDPSLQASRAPGMRADEAYLRARAHELSAAGGDAEAARLARVALARWLASRDRDLDEAVEHATAALAVAEDAELRRELSSWLESLGESARAAAILKPIASMADVESQEAAYVLVRAGVLQARAGLALGAAAAFGAAAAVDASDPLPPELLARLSAWPEGEDEGGGPPVTPADAADAYVEGARRRASLQQDDVELEDLWRAVDADPRSDPAGNELVRALEARGRLSAADEVRRARSPTAGDGAAPEPAGGGAIDPKNARVAAILADRATPGPDREVAATLERAIAVVGPRSRWCAALADTFDALGDMSSAVNWTQRLVALRPGDRGAIGVLLERLARAGDPSRLGDALSWLLTQPLPVSWMKAPFVDGLRALARADADRAAIVARRTLDVLGPRSPELRSVMSEVAALASDKAFAAAILERWLFSGAEGDERAAIFVELADLRRHLGDDEARARLVARAVEEGISSPAIDAHIAALGERPASPDGHVWRLRARAARLAADSDREASSVAWRDLGAALWDLADDRTGALAAWRNAVRGGSVRAYAAFATDVLAFSDAEFAFAYLTDWVAEETDGETAAAIATGTARAALKAGERGAAFEFATRAVARCPLMAEALEVAERAVDAHADLKALSGLYDLVAERSFGRFGRRAAHYRAARFFERRLESSLALKHACRAFFAVPSEGAGFHLLARAADRARDPSQAMHTIEQVAEAATLPEVRTAWFLRAATLAGNGPEGAQRRLDVLLRAAMVLPSVSVIDRLRVVARDLLGEGPDEDALIEARLVGALRAVGQRLAGPDGARVSIACASVALDLFADSEAGLDFVERAFACDADVDEYEQLLRWGPALGLTPSARDRVASVFARAEGAFANLGVAALRLLGAMAVVFRDEPLRARISVDIASREADDDAAVVEADAAVRRVPALAEALAKRVKPERRAEALCIAARGLSGSGRHAEAAALFERALDLLDSAARPGVEAELRAAWDAAGRGAETEARVQMEAADATGLPAVRAGHWMEIAARREARGDLAGAVKAVVEACTLDRDPLERWSALERIADMAGDAAATVDAMEAIAVRVDARGRVAVFKRLARFHQRTGDPVASEHAWRRVLTLDPDDEDADHAVESLVAGSGRFEDLADHLRRRADRLSAQSEKRETLRAVRLRLAAILEQRLGRVEDACEQLGVLLSEWPDNPGALRYLADLLDRRGEPARAAPLWSRAAAVESDPAGRSELEVKAAWAALAAGDPHAALEHVNRAGSGALVHAESLALRVEIARAAGSDRDLGDALEAMAVGGALDGMRAGDVLLEAAQAAARAGDSTLALERACRAADAVPERATPQLLARGLEYRLRGPGTVDEARSTIQHLTRIGEALEAADAALRSFLLAEALDILQGTGAGLRELEAARASLGSHPLIALGLAERFAAQGLTAAAVDAYELALAGSLLDLRKASSVALAAADVAIRAHRWQDAARFLDMAEADDETRAGAQAARALLVEHVTAGARAPVPIASPVPVAPVVEAGDPRMADLEGAVRAGGSPVARANARLALGRMRLGRGDPHGAEQLLWEALADGLAEAGDALAPLLASAPDRARDLVRLRRQQVSIEPGDRGRLEALRAAALADDDRTYAAAVEHVLRAFDPASGPLPPPPLAAQPKQPGIFALLTRPSLDAAGEALAAIWEGAMHLFVKDPATYGIAGVERVVPSAGSPLGRLYEVVMRVLDLPRIPIFVPRPTVVPPTSQVAVLSPPSVVLNGEVREESLELRFALGYGLAATLPQNVLRLGLTRMEGRALIEALHAAFGPPEIGRRVDARAARLAQSFWQSVPSRTQRRLQVILGHGPLGEYEDLLARAHQSGVRAGMFLAGDFGWAARRLLAESSALAGAETRPAAGSSPGTLRAMCDEVPMLADLLRLAVSPEYADARWHGEPPGSRQATLSSKGYRFF